MLGKHGSRDTKRQRSRRMSHERNTGGSMGECRHQRPERVRAFVIGLVLLAGCVMHPYASAADTASLRTEVEGYLRSLPASAADQAAEARRLLARANELQADGQSDAARERIMEAREIAIQAVATSRGGETVVYSKEFRTPRDEYRYVREQHATYAQLFDEVMARKGSSGDTSGDPQRAYQRARSMIERAEQLASRGDWEEASAMAANANRELGEELKKLGLPISQ